MIATLKRYALFIPKAYYAASKYLAGHIPAFLFGMVIEALILVPAIVKVAT